MDKVKRYFDFLFAMTEKEIKARYKKAVFGFLWIFINPLLQMVIIGFIFSFFLKIPNYFLFLFTGLLLWQFFSLSLQKATPSFVHERNLLKKAKFPMEAIPISIVLANYINLSIALFILVIYVFLFMAVQINFFLIITVLIWLLITTISICLLTATLNVKYRDVNFFVQSGTILWFYATPILYHLRLVPNTFLAFYWLNPLTSIVELTHKAFSLPHLLTKELIVANIVITIIIIFISVKTFMKKGPYLVDWL